MEALQFNVSTPRAGKVLWAIYEPLFWSGLSCLHYGNCTWAALPGQLLTDSGSVSTGGHFAP